LDARGSGRRNKQRRRSLDNVLRWFLGTFEAGSTAVLVAPSKVKTCYAARLDFSCTNNIAEYEALLLRFRKLRAMGIRKASLKTDSQVISGDIDKSSKARDPKLEKYLDTVRRLETSFEGFSVKNIPRGGNEHADLLAKSAAQGLPLPSEVFFETIKAHSVELMERAVLAISQYIAKIGGLKSYLSSKVIIFRTMKLTIREWKQG
jgi:ribonuclease HI